MKTKIQHLLGAVLALFLTIAFTQSAADQTPPDTRIVYSADVTDRKTKQTSRQIFSMNDDGSGVVQLTSEGSALPTWSWDKRYILFHRSSPVENTIYIMDLVAPVLPAWVVWGEKNPGEDDIEQRQGMPSIRH